MVEVARPSDYEVCPKCKTKTLSAPGIGPYCPNQDCDVIDNLSGATHPGMPVHVVVGSSKERTITALESARDEALATSRRMGGDDFYIGKGAGLQGAIDIVRSSDETNAVPDAWLVLTVGGWRYLSGGEGDARQRMRDPTDKLYPLYRGELKALPPQCSCDPNPSIGGSPPCPVHDGENEEEV